MTIESDFITNSKLGLEREGLIKAKAMDYKPGDVSSAPGLPPPDFRRDEPELCGFPLSTFKRILSFFSSAVVGIRWASWPEVLMSYSDVIKKKHHHIKVMDTFNLLQLQLQVN